MQTESAMEAAIRAVLTRDRSVRAQSEGGSLRFRCAEGIVTLEGMVDSLAEKKTSERLIRELPEIRDVHNHLRIRPVPERSDAIILQHVRDGLEADGGIDANRLIVTVQDGVVTLKGTQDALTKKRLAGLVAWWTAGTMDVRNEIDIDPPESDSDAEITDALRLAFEKDPLLDALRYQVSTRHGVVYLNGIASSPVARQAAEDDAWAIWGVQDVHNQISLEA